VDAREQYMRASASVDCSDGLARTALRCGDVRAGLALLADETSADLLCECADILEAGRHLPEAAQLLERANLMDRAADLHIRLKNWTRVSQLLKNVTAPRIHAQFARAKEAEGRYMEAVAAYKTAGDPESAVRLLLEKLRLPEEAVRIVRETRSPVAAKSVCNLLKWTEADAFLQLLLLFVFLPCLLLIYPKK
jgi:WD repeat-containing protein 19